MFNRCHTGPGLVRDGRAKVNGRNIVDVRRNTVIAPVRSERTKWMPVPGAAGFNTMRTRLPEWRPIPAHTDTAANVFRLLTLNTLRNTNQTNEVRRK